MVEKFHIDIKIDLNTPMLSDVCCIVFELPMNQGPCPLNGAGEMLLPTNVPLTKVERCDRDISHVKQLYKHKYTQDCK